MHATATQGGASTSPHACTVHAMYPCAMAILSTSLQEFPWVDGTRMQGWGCWWGAGAHRCHARWDKLLLHTRIFMPHARNFHVESAI
jgi:hypothetical protein